MEELKALLTDFPTMNRVQLAAFFGVPHSTLNNWLNGVRKLPKPSFLKISYKIGDLKKITIDQLTRTVDLFSYLKDLPETDEINTLIDTL